MSELVQITQKVLPVVKVLLDCYGSNKQLYPLQEAVHDLQLAVNWLLLAAKDTPQHDNDFISGKPEGSISRPMVTTPTLLSPQEHFGYIKTELASIHKQLETFLQENHLQEPTHRKVGRGTDKIMEAIFNTNLALDYYEQPRTFRVV